jgi:hypothetical protein
MVNTVNPDTPAGNRLGREPSVDLPRNPHNPSITVSRSSENYRPSASRDGTRGVKVCRNAPAELEAPGSGATILI